MRVDGNGRHTMNASDIDTTDLKKALVVFDLFGGGDSVFAESIRAELDRRRQEVRYFQSRRNDNVYSCLIGEAIIGEIVNEAGIGRGTCLGDDVNWKPITAAEYAEAKAKAGKMEPAVVRSVGECFNEYCQQSEQPACIAVECSGRQPAPEELAIEPSPPSEPVDALPSVFQKELEQPINRHSLENSSATPDFILGVEALNRLTAGRNDMRTREDLILTIERRIRETGEMDVDLWTAYDSGVRESRTLLTYNGEIRKNLMTMLDLLTAGKETPCELPRDCDKCWWFDDQCPDGSDNHNGKCKNWKKAYQPTEPAPEVVKPARIGEGTKLCKGCRKLQSRCVCDKNPPEVKAIEPIDILDAPYSDYPIELVVAYMNNERAKLNETIEAVNRLTAGKE